MHAPFVHLRVKSAYSLLEGMLRPAELAQLAYEGAMPAVAVLDVGNLFGVYEIADRLAARGVQPIIGALLHVETTNKGSVGSISKPPLLPLLVQNEEGFANLARLLSAAYLAAEPADWPHVDFGALTGRTSGLIALTGGKGGPLNELIAQNQLEAARHLLRKLAELFPRRLYIELQRHGLAEERVVERTLIDLAYSEALPLVATNDVHFATTESYPAQDALLCIADGTFVGQDNRRTLTKEHRFKSAAEMCALFSDLPEAIDNTLLIARRCSFRPQKRNPILPEFVPPSGRTPADELRVLAREGLARRLTSVTPAAELSVYHERLEYELDIIIAMNFPGYFLIVSDFMKWTRQREIPVGIRGSGATSLVAWSLDITNLDPIRFGLVFERFLNPERISLPDFDIDFCQERRDEVVSYVRAKYGRDRVAHIIALGSLHARQAVRDVGRVLQMPLSLVDRVAKLIPNPPGRPVTLADAIRDEPRLQAISQQEPITEQLFSIVEKIEGLYRHASTHPAGIVIGDRPLDEIVPLYRDPRSEMPVTQYDYEDAERAGLVKFDLLGLKTLTVIAKAEELLKRRGVVVDTQNIDFDDKATFEMLSCGDSIGVFQLEGKGMRELIRKMKPDHINDLVALVALYRPGPMDSIPKYIACKAGREQPDYLHPLLEPILKETFGVMTYQEDVMRIARELAGYTMGEADLLRRAMGKKIPAEMAAHSQRFIAGAGKKGIMPGVAEQIFEQAAKFAGYGFNKGHAAAYAQVAYQTAFLKANYPVEFLAASMTLDIGSPDRINVFRQEARRLGIRVMPPDINRSDALFSCDAAEGVIFYALAAVKGVGRQAMEHVVALRSADGVFASVADFARRVDPRLVNKRALESLVRAGAFDSLHSNRRQLVESADNILLSAAASQRDRESGQSNIRLAAVCDWEPYERLSEEFGAMGFYLSGHPLDAYETALRRLGVVTFASLQEDRRRAGFQATLAGTIVRKYERRGRNDQPYAFVTFSDSAGMYEVMFFPEVLAQSRTLLEAGRSVLLKVSAAWEGDELKLRAASVSELETAAASAGEGIVIQLGASDALGAIATELCQPGKGIVRFIVPGGSGEEVQIELAKRQYVTPQLKNTIRQLPGVLAVESL